MIGNEKTIEFPAKAFYNNPSAGGVHTDEIDPQTMESRLVSNVYFAGEVVDIDGMCGGYNLQWAWSSGYVAGIHSAGSYRTHFCVRCTEK